MGDDLHLNKQNKQTNIFIANHRYLNDAKGEDE
jgi:hypothetical protein